MSAKQFRKKRWHAPFLEALASYGVLTTAANLAPVARSLVYRELEHPEFQRQVRETLERHRDALVLRILTLAADQTTPKHLTLAALEYLVERADRRLERQVESRPDDLQSQQNTLVITVNAETAKRLFMRPAIPLLPVNGNGSSCQN